MMRAEVESIQFRPRGLPQQGLKPVVGPFDFRLRHHAPGHHGLVSHDYQRVTRFLEPAESQRSAFVDPNLVRSGK